VTRVANCGGMKPGAAMSARLRRLRVRGIRPMAALLGSDRMKQLLSMDQVCRDGLLALL
jgi:hypothetical protein